MMITKPMKPFKLQDESLIKLPVLATPKIDGIRCLKIDGQALSNSFKPIPNHYVRRLIEAECPDGFDGELVVMEGEFNDSQSAFMSREGKPKFLYKVFDYVKHGLDEPYVSRVNRLDMQLSPGFIEKLIPIHIYTLDELQAYEQQMLTLGHEGVIIRSPLSPYKCGRSTLREGYLIALKRFVDSEAIIVGFEPRYHNANPSFTGELGQTKRSSHQENKIELDTLGVILATDIHTGVSIRVGTGKGLTDTFREKIWKNQSLYLNRMFTYQFQEHGMKDKPRILSFKGFRHIDDI